VVGAAVVLLGASGCGLSEYEEKLDREQKRLQQIDETNKFLGDPIEVPQIKDPNPNAPPGATTDIFFRPPRGIGSKFEATPRGELLYQYPNVSRTLASVQRRQVSAEESLFLNVFAAVTPTTAPPGNWEAFAIKVQQAFAGLTPSGQPVLVPVSPPGRSRMEFQSLSFAEPANDATKQPTIYRVYFYKGESYNVAIVYHHGQDKVQNADVNKIIDFSLQSLALGPEAATKSSQWQRSHPRK
jgi:hypothetical protein